MTDELKPSPAPEPPLVQIGNGGHPNGPEVTGLPDEDKSGPMTRRGALMKIGILLNGIVGIAIATPVIRYLLGPVRRNGAYNSWVTVGPLDNFPEGETRLASFVSPGAKPWDGDTAKTACWVRRTEKDKFQVFAINCAHLGCPVRWFAQSQVFMCPCHGGVYYADGSRASGPPERGLFTYDYEVRGEQLFIDAGQMPTLATEAALRGNRPCAG